MTTELIDAYAYCPLCGSEEYAREGRGRGCRRCGHRDFNNAITAVAVFVIDAQERVLLIRRAREPAMGKWAPPGGFLDAGETLEHAAVREVAEETGVEIRNLRYLSSFPNAYSYRGLGRPVCDVFFTAVSDSPGVALQQEEADQFRWRSLAEINPSELAFDSMRHALAILQGSFSVHRHP